MPFSKRGAAGKKLFGLSTADTEQSTEKKEVIVRALVPLVEGARSLLHIGAGDGALAIPLSRVVTRYVALDRRPTHLRALKAAGLEVIEGTFPCPVRTSRALGVRTEGFARVVACEIVPSRQDQLEAFITSAWSSVESQGALILVVLDDEDSEWRLLLEKLGLFEDSGIVPGRIDTIASMLVGKGSLDMIALGSVLVSDGYADFIAELARIYLRGDAGHDRCFRATEALLKARYWNGTSFLFPLTHLIYRCIRF